VIRSGACGTAGAPSGGAVQGWRRHSDHVGAPREGQNSTSCGSGWRPRPPTPGLDREGVGGRHGGLAWACAGRRATRLGGAAGDRGRCSTHGRATCGRRRSRSRRRLRKPSRGGRLGKPRAILARRSRPIRGMPSGTARPSSVCQPAPSSTRMMTRSGPAARLEGEEHEDVRKQRLVDTDGEILEPLPGGGRDEGRGRRAIRSGAGRVALGRAPRGGAGPASARCVLRCISLHLGAAARGTPLWSTSTSPSLTSTTRP
jgi:hypothetical protein